MNIKVEGGSGKAQKTREVVLNDEELRCFRTKICNNLVKGRCNFKESRCIFSHNTICTRRCPLYLSNTSFIRYIPLFCSHVVFTQNFKTVKSNCPFGNECIYSHSLDEILYHPQFYKTITCEHYLKGVCKHIFCPFVHEDSERRQIKHYKLPFTNNLYIPPNKYITVVDTINQRSGSKKKSDSDSSTTHSTGQSPGLVPENRTISDAELQADLNILRGMCTESGMPYDFKDYDDYHQTRRVSNYSSRLNSIDQLLSQLTTTLDDSFMTKEMLYESIKGLLDTPRVPGG
uniref:C3H1-type domain-containing protein n=1 Tax=Theileria annulata TaxID=5874 RepID=A0A3B0N3M1_THEAN